MVGDSSGKTMVQKRRNGLAPSIAAASMRDFGIDCSPARKTTNALPTAQKLTVTASLLGDLARG